MGVIAHSRCLIPIHFGKNGSIYIHEYTTKQVLFEVAALPTGVYFIKVSDIEVRNFVKE